MGPSVSRRALGRRLDSTKARAKTAICHQSVVRIERVKSSSLAAGTAWAWTAAETAALTSAGAGLAAISLMVAAQIAGSADGSLAWARAEKQAWKRSAIKGCWAAGNPATVSSWRSCGRAAAEGGVAV